MVWGKRDEPLFSYLYENLICMVRVLRIFGALISGRLYHAAKMRKQRLSKVRQLNLDFRKRTFAKCGVFV